MAKMKVHELAKELDITSKEVLAFLQEKGIEAKAAQSSVEEKAVEIVRKAFRRHSRKRILVANSRLRSSASGRAVFLNWRGRIR